MLYPLPAVMVSCARDGEKPNIITAAWVGTICSDPAMVSVSIRPERYSYDMIRETGEFVINLTTKKLAWAADYCGVRSGRDVDKFKETGLTPGRAQHLKLAPVIEESLAFRSGKGQRQFFQKLALFLQRVRKKPAGGRAARQWEHAGEGRNARWRTSEAAQRRPARIERKNRAFSTKRQAVWFEMQRVSN